MAARSGEHVQAFSLSLTSGNIVEDKFCAICVLAVESATVGMDVFAADGARVLIGSVTHTTNSRYIVWLQQHASH